MHGGVDETMGQDQNLLMHREAILQVPLRWVDTYDDGAHHGPLYLQEPPGAGDEVGGSSRRGLGPDSEGGLHVGEAPVEELRGGLLLTW